MRPSLALGGVASVLGLSLACGAPAPTEPAKPACDLTTATLAGKTFVESKILPDRKEEPDPMARVKFVDEGGVLHAKYTVKNGLHVYDYTCSVGAREGEIKCVTKPDPKRTCLAFEVHADGACTPEAVAALGFDTPAEDVTKAAEEARKLVAEAKAGPSWPTFKIMNNNVANPLQGVLYVKVDAEKCRIVMEDMYVTVFEGKKVEDFNPIGTNPFVRDDAEYLFEDCSKEGMLADVATPELPSDLSQLPPNRRFPVGAPVHYLYAGDVEVTPAEGCTYSVDTWATWRPVAKGVAVEPVDGKLVWKAEHTWPADTKKVLVGIEAGQGVYGGFFHLARRKTCNGTTSTIDVVCAATTLD